jgi:hypothetical protein
MTRLVRLIAIGTLIMVFIWQAVSYGEERPGSQSPPQKKRDQFVLKELLPYDASAELAGTFLLSADDKGGFHTEGFIDVLKDGFVVTRRIVQGVEVEFGPGGRMKVPVKKGDRLDGTWGIWLPGVRHEIRGTLKDHGSEGYVFQSNAKAPLVFKLVKDVGYVYVKGRGSVQTPDGKKYNLVDR